MPSTEAVYLQEVKWCLSLVLFVGCWNDEPGLHLEVRTGGTGATRIELYLATRPCTSCANLLRPKGVHTKLPGPVWLLDGDTMVRTPNTVYDVKAGKVVFDLLPPAAADVDIEYIVAVGYEPEGKVVGVAKLTGVTIPHDRAKFWKIALDEAADQASSPALQPEGNRVWVWRRSSAATADLAACIGIEHSDGKTIERTWLVPADDTDCDEVPANVECDRFNYQAMGTSDLDKANCATATSAPTVVPAGACLLGGPSCIDGSSNSSCGPVLPYFCLPSVVCASSSCRQDLVACVANGLVTHFKITMPATTNMGPCEADTSQNSVIVDLSALVPTKPGLTRARCTDIKFARLDVNNAITLTTDFTPNGATFTAGQLAAPCSFLFSWTAGNVSTQALFTFLDLALSNGTHELLPVRIDLQPADCNAAPDASVTPHYTAADQLSSCALADDKSGP